MNMHINQLISALKAFRKRADQIIFKEYHEQKEFEHFLKICGVCEEQIEFVSNLIIRWSEECYESRTAAYMVFQQFAAANRVTSMCDLIQLIERYPSIHQNDWYKNHGLIYRDKLQKGEVVYFEEFLEGLGYERYSMGR